MMPHERADRLRIATLLLAPRDSESGAVRTPLSNEAAMARIRTMMAEDRARLSSQITWVRAYEGHGPHDEAS